MLQQTILQTPLPKCVYYCIKHMLHIIYLFLNNNSLIIAIFMCVEYNLHVYTVVRDLGVTMT